jgi:tetratricopeptide (TPR) repeat protein
MKEINADSLAEKINWVRTHKETALTAAGIFVACCGFMIYFFSHYAGVNREAWNRISYAQGYAFQGMNDQAVKILDEVIGLNPRIRTLQFARLYKADILCKMKEYEKAAGLYSQIVANPKFKPILPLAYLGLGNSLESLGKYSEAIKVYSEFIDKLPEHFLIPRAYESLGRTCELAGMPEQAKQAYEKLSTLYPGTLWSQDAQKRMNIILQVESKIQKQNQK